MAEADRERWDRRYAESADAAPSPPEWLAELDDELPRRGRALDVAAGTGRMALWLAARGLEVTAVDISPVGLARCREAAAARGLRVETRQLDLEVEPLPAGPFQAIACVAYLQRDLFPALRERLAPGGVLICELSTERNLERHAHPSARFLVRTNELLALAAPLEIVAYREGWLEDHCRARLVARKPAI